MTKSREKLYEEKAGKIIDEAVNYCTTYTDRKQKLLSSLGTTKKLESACNDYIILSMGSYLTGKDSRLHIKRGACQISDTRPFDDIEDFHNDITIGSIENFTFNYKIKGSQNYREYMIVKNDIGVTNPMIYHISNHTLRPMSLSDFDPDFVQALQATLNTTSYFIEEGFRRGCVYLHQRGAWNFSANLSEQLRECIYKDEINWEVLDIEITNIAKKISPNLEVEYKLDLDSGRNESFPAFTITYAKCDEMESSYFPQKTSLGWQLAIITDGNNLKDILNDELNLFVKRVNEIISYHKGN